MFFPTARSRVRLDTHQYQVRESEVRDDRGRRAGDLDGLGRGWGAGGAVHASVAPTGSIPGVCSERAPPSERGCGLHTHQVRGRGSEVRDDRGRRAGDLDGLGRGWGVVGLCTRQPRQQGRSREFVPNELHRLSSTPTK